MQRDELQATLRRLHDELSRTEGVDSESLARLRTFADELQRTLDERDEAAEVESSASGLKAFLLKFEADHPQMSDTIGRVADALAAMGI